MYGVHVSAPYRQGNRFLIMSRAYTRKLLMHKSEINKLHAPVKKKFLLLNFHFSHGYVKVTVGLVTGKLYDKRQDMAERDAKRDIAKAIKTGKNTKL